MVSLNMISVSQHLLFFLCPFLRESLHDSTNHLPEPVEVEKAQCCVSTDIQSSQPTGEHPTTERHIQTQTWDISHGERQTFVSKGSRGVPRFPHIIVDKQRLISAPNESRASERSQQEDAVIELSFRTRLIEFV
jgi:hypothetical protein